MEGGPEGPPFFRAQLGCLNSHIPLMRALFYRHPYLVVASTLLTVGLSAYGLWFATPVISQFIFPAAVTATFLMIMGKLPQTIWDWAFVILILLPFAFVAISAVEFLRPILPLIIAVAASVAVRNKLVKGKTHGLHDSRNSDRKF